MRLDRRPAVGQPEHRIAVAAVLYEAEPVSIGVETFGTGKIADDKIVELIRKHFDLTPGGMIEMLDLRRPIYTATAAYGHFGRSERDFTWERTDRAKDLAKDS